MKKILITTFLAVFLVGCGDSEPKSNEEEQSRSPAAPASPPSVSLLDASWDGDLEAVKQHIAAGSDLNEKNASGANSLVIASTSGQTEVVKALLEGGADVNSRNKEGSTPLHVAAFLCQTDIVSLMLDNGADKNARNNAGATALESVAGPFEDVKGIYDYLGQIFGPLGVELDYERIKATRPKIAEMLRQ